MTSAVDVAQLEDRLTRQIDKIAADIASSAQQHDKRTRAVEDRLTRIEVAREAEDRAGSSVSLVSAERYEDHRAAFMKWQREVNEDLRSLRKFMFIATGVIIAVQSAIGWGLKVLA